MPRSGFQEQKLSRSVFRARDDSPDSVIFTNESGFSVFSSASGSVDRCSFGSDGHDHDHKSLDSELSKHLAGRDLHRQSSCGSDLDTNRASGHKKNSNTIKNRDEAKEEEEEEEEAAAAAEEEVNAQDPARHSLSLAAKECQIGVFRSEVLAKKYERQRQASLDLNNRLSDVTSSSPRFTAMKKATASSRGSGTFPSPGAPNYRHANGSGSGLQKGWSSERVPLPTNSGRRYANAIPFPFNGGRTLPSKWEDAEKWIFSPSAGDGVNRPTLNLPPPQRRPKSKSGPLGPPGMACYSSSFSPSMMMPVFDGGRVGNFMGSSPFSAGVLGADVLSGRASSGIGCGGGGGGEAYPARTEPSVARSVSVHGWSDLLIQSSLPSSEDEKLDGTKDAITLISPAVSRRDAATQMSPDGSTYSSPRARPSFSPPSSVLPMTQLESHHSSKLEIKDVEVDDCVTVTRWSKKHGSRGLNKGSTKIRSWRKKAAETQASAWEVSETTKSISKFKREEAKIIAWENLQKAKAEADIRKLEMKLEKIRTSSMDKIMNKLRSAQRKAQEMRSSVSTSEEYQISRTTNKVAFFRKSSQMSSLSGCFTCHAF
ncbi:hypothetical protein AAC387_Pa04g2734 [Persea americana]